MLSRVLAESGCFCGVQLLQSEIALESRLMELEKSFVNPRAAPSAKSIRRRTAKPVRVRGYNDDLFVRPERPPRLPEEPTAMYEEEDGEEEEVVMVAVETSTDDFADYESSL